VTNGVGKAPRKAVTPAAEYESGIPDPSPPGAAGKGVRVEIAAENDAAVASVGLRSLLDRLERCEHLASAAARSVDHVQVGGRGGEHHLIYLEIGQNADPPAEALFAALEVVFTAWKRNDLRQRKRVTG